MSDVKEMSGVGRKCEVVLPESFKSIHMSLHLRRLPVAILCGM